MRPYDLIVIGAIAIVLLLPKPSLKAQPALVGDPTDLDRIAELQDAWLADPNSAERATELADSYLRVYRPDWALATLAPFATTPDPRVHLVRATAFAERLEAQATVDEGRRGLQSCDSAGPARCTEAMRIKLRVIADSMQALVDGKIDPYQNPQKARDAVSRVLHSTRLDPDALKPTPKAPAKPVR